MSIIEVQGVVSSESGLPFVQFRQVDENDQLVFSMQLDPTDAREFAHNVVEAAANAIYEAAIFSWAKNLDPKTGEQMGLAIIKGLRNHRADKWGLPSSPEDWRPDNV